MLRQMLGLPHPNSSCPAKSAKRVFALDAPGIHVFLCWAKTWMAGTKPGHDGGCRAVHFTSRRAHPIAVKAVGHPMPELHQRHRAGLDVGGVEDREIAAVFARPPDRGQ